MSASRLERETKLRFDSPSAAALPARRKAIVFIRERLAFDLSHVTPESTRSPAVIAACKRGPFIGDQVRLCGRLDTRPRRGAPPR